MVALSPPKSPKIFRGRPKEVPKITPRSPKRSQKAPRIGPRDPQIGPRGHLKRPKITSNQKIKKTSKMTTLSMKINDFGGPNHLKNDANKVKASPKYKKIAVKWSTRNKDYQKWALRPFRKSTGSPKRLTSGIDPRARALIFGPVGPPKML